MTLDDILLYLDFIKAHSDDGVLSIRIIHSYPEDYITLLRENERLRNLLSNYEYHGKVNMELLRDLTASQELTALKEWLKAHNISIKEFKF